jgi:hypothetical protein
VLHNTRLKRLAKDKHSSLVGPIVSYGKSIARKAENVGLSSKKYEIHFFDRKF